MVLFQDRYGSSADAYLAVESDMMRFCPRLPQLFVCLVAVTGIPLQSDQMRSASAQQSLAPVVSAAQRTDSFETKLKLLEDAWRRKDFDLARSLTSSLRDTVMQTQVETQNPGVSLTHMDSMPVNSLPAEWTQWAAGWAWFQTFTLEEIAGELRRSEPVEISISFPAAQASDLHRELRLACIQDGQLAEVPCQVFHEVRRNDERSCRVLLMADSQPLEKRTYVVFYGNPAAERPNYPSDLKTEGEGYGLDIFNAYFKASLSRQTGQLERLTLRREHGLELFAGGEGHGEAPGIDWAHDYVDAGFFQKLRISLWDACPDYEVIRGPLCTIVRRWGFPRSPIHPVDSPSRLNVGRGISILCRPTMVP